MKIIKTAVAGLGAAAAITVAGVTLAGPASADTAVNSSVGTWPTLTQGQRSEDVRALQWLLNCHGISVGVPSHFGPATYRAVRTYQSRHGLTADGKVGAYTWVDLTSRSQVRYGDRNDCVRALQVELNKYKGVVPGKDLPISGYFGPRTLDAVHRFETNFKLTKTNTVDIQVWRDLVAESGLAY